MRLAKRERSQQSIERGLGVFELHANRNNRNWLQIASDSAKIDRVFLGGDEAIGFGLLLEREQIANIGWRVAVMIAKRRFGCWFDFGFAELKEEVLRARNAAKCHRALRNASRKDAAAHAPNMFSFNHFRRQRFHRSSAHQHNGIGAAQRGERLAQASLRQHVIAQIFGRNQDDIEIARELAVLEPIVEQVEMLTEFFFGEHAGSVALISHDLWNFKFLCDQ
jgi:hypothetical protein